MKVSAPCNLLPGHFAMGNQKSNHFKGTHPHPLPPYSIATIADILLDSSQYIALFLGVPLPTC